MSIRSAFHSPRLPRANHRTARVLLCILTLAVPSFVRAHGSFHERMAQLTLALERNPADARANFELAEIFLRHGDWALALGSADSADQFQPGAFPTDLVRGEALLAGGQPAAARAALDRFLVARPGHAPALVLRARARAALDGPAAALADFRAALESTPRPDPDHVREAAAAFANCGQRDEAIRLLARALGQLGPDPALLQLALPLEIAAGRFDSALARITALQASALRPEPWMARRAQVLAQAGRSAEARTAWTALLTHLESLPNLERGTPALRALAREAQAALAATSS